MKLINNIQKCMYYIRNKIDKPLYLAIVEGE